DAFSPSLMSDTIHPVIPVAAAHQRKAVRSGRQAPVDGLDAMLVDRAVLARVPGMSVGFHLAGLERRRLEEGHPLLENGVVAGRLDVTSHRQGKPQAIVGAARAHARARVGMPPVLDVPLAELPSRGPEAVPAG